jgi:uncharacterized membrane protein HdeD (DUF308 family)
LHGHPNVEVLTIPDGAPFAPGLPPGLRAGFAPAPAEGQGANAEAAGPLAILSATASRLTETLGAPASHHAAKKMPALVPGGWALVLRGGASIAVGSLSLATRGLSLATLIGVVAAYALVDGALTLVGAVGTTRAHERWWPLLLEGLVSMGLGAQVLLWAHSLDAATLLYYVALWSLVAGGLELCAAWRLREEIAGEYLLALRGLTAMGLGALLAFGGSEAGLLSWLGPSATLFGALFVALGLRLRSWNALPKYDAERPVYAA